MRVGPAGGVWGSARPGAAIRDPLPLTSVMSVSEVQQRRAAAPTMPGGSGGSGTATASSAAVAGAGACASSGTGAGAGAPWGPAAMAAPGAGVGGGSSGVSPWPDVPSSVGTPAAGMPMMDACVETSQQAGAQLKGDGTGSLGAASREARRLLAYGKARVLDPDRNPIGIVV